VTRSTLLLLAILALGARADAASVTVGSKAFPESWVLAEALAQAMRSEGVPRVEHRNNLGGTEIVYQALRSGNVDAYPEYTGTILEVVLHNAHAMTTGQMREALAKEGLGVSDPIGFNDGYALAVTSGTRDRYGLRTISDLKQHPDLKLGLTHEFLGRPDGYPGLARHYGLAMRHVLGIQHELAYTALASGRIDVTDIYTTDAQIQRMGLYVLEDDRGFFPRYDAVWLYRLDLEKREPRAIEAMRRLTGVIDEGRMIRANARVVLGGRTYRESADSLLAEVLARAPARPAAGGGSEVAASILRNTGQHLRLVALSLLIAVLVGVPLGVLAARSAFLGSAILSLTGLLQTIPSLALLALLIPLFGIGVIPALIALFLYSLLPIVRNTYVGLTTIPPPLAEAADAIGLPPVSQLFRVRLPMASPAIMAGIKTSAIINVGTATLAALIGAGGLGEPILSGIQLRQNGLILQGAVPAAVLALLVQGGFDLIDRLVIPRGLRLPSGRA
jgi:osmoprotectant transport system substrate-binding protein/osmoprotectant transport system permease protein